MTHIFIPSYTQNPSFQTLLWVLHEVFRHVCLETKTTIDPGEHRKKTEVIL